MKSLKSRTLILALFFVIVAFTFAACTQPAMAPASMPKATVEKTELTSMPPADTPVPSKAPTTEASPPTQEVMAWAADGVVGEGEYDGSVSEAGVTFYWRTDGESLFGALSAETTGWVSVAFDPENRMQGANYIFGYVKDGQATLFDMFGIRPSGPGSHPPDDTLGGSNDILAFGGRESDGTTVIEFQIPLNSGDGYDKPLTVGKEYKILLVWGANDDLGYHGGRGATMISLTLHTGAPSSTPPSSIALPKGFAPEGIV